MVKADNEAELKDHLFNLMQCVACHSGGRITAVEDRSDCLTLFKDGRILGRSHGIYGFMAKTHGWKFTLPTIWEEVLMSLRREIPESYNAAIPDLRAMGSLVYDRATGELMQWNDLFRD